MEACSLRAVPGHRASRTGCRLTGAAPLDPDTEFYVPKPLHGAIEQFADLASAGNHEDDRRIRDLIDIPQAVWFTEGTPMSVQQDVVNTVQRAARKGTVPVLVAYYVPGRDCSQYSAGGAPTGTHTGSGSTGSLRGLATKGW